jgi:hypothetical protein
LVGDPPWLKEADAMWIQTTIEPGRPARLALLCDECGAIFERSGHDDRKAHWHVANVAGWARIARAPERHVCAEC